MKKINLLIIIIGVLFTACFKTEKAPPLMFDGVANITIAELQKYHTLNYTDPITLIEDDVIFTGIVTSTDKYGSCYKELFLQDETGGISLRINNSSYYTKYRIGQQIFVKAKGLYLGNYVSGNRTGFYQMGLYGNSNGGMEYISGKKENQHIFRHSYPVAEPDAKIISKNGDINKEIGGDYHTLVKLTNCSFGNLADGTNTYHDGSNFSTISRNVQLSDGNIVQARISMYCTFANEILPEGALNITGILTMFGNDPQLIIRSIEDVYIIPPTPPAKILKSYDMTTNPFNEGWLNNNVTGTTNWIYYGDTKNVRIMPPQGDETECWLVSPKFNFAGEKDVAISFNHRLTAGTSENAQVLYTIDGINWIPIDFIPQTGTANEALLKLSESIATNPNLQIAFRYKTSTIYPLWAINSITFLANVL